MRCPRVVHRLSAPLATFVLAALVMPAALACGILTSDPASSPTTPPSDSSSSEVAGSRKDGEPGTGIEFEPKATPRPTATSLPTATPYPTATAFPTAAAVSTQTAGSAPSVPTTVPTPASAEGAATPGSSPAVVPAATAVAGTSPGPSTGPTQFTFSGRTELKHPKVGSTLDDLIARVQAGEISAEEAAKAGPYSSGRLGGSDHPPIRECGWRGSLPGSQRRLEYFCRRRLHRSLCAYPCASGDLRTARGPSGSRDPTPGIEPQSGSGLPATAPRFTATAAWNQAGYTGRGIKVGVIDGGFGTFADLMGTEVPAGSTPDAIRSWASIPKTWKTAGRVLTARRLQSRSWT